MLSGTATWLALSLFSGIGPEFIRDGIRLDPVLREEQEVACYRIRPMGCEYKMTIRKPAGFSRMLDKPASIEVDGKPVEGNVIPMFSDGKEHSIEVTFS